MYNCLRWIRIRSVNSRSCKCPRNIRKNESMSVFFSSSVGVEIKTVRSNTFGYKWNQICCESGENKVRIVLKKRKDFLSCYICLSIRRELEQRLRELKRRKKEKKLAKAKEFDEERERDKKRWTDFNSKVSRLSLVFPPSQRCFLFSWQVEHGKVLYRNQWLKLTNATNNYVEQQMAT